MLLSAGKDMPTKRLIDEEFDIDLMWEDMERERLDRELYSNQPLRRVFRCKYCKAPNGHHRKACRFNFDNRGHTPFILWLRRVFLGKKVL